MASFDIVVGDALTELRRMEAGTFNTCVTSPPYFGLRDYDHEDQIGSEDSVEDFIEALVQVFGEVRRVLRDDGTLWLNLGDSYGAGKQLQGVPWRVALALQADGWILRQELIWHKPNCMPESVKDRCTRNHEHIFLLAKEQSYHYDIDAIRVPVAASSILRASRGNFRSTHPSAAGSTEGGIDVDMNGRFVDVERGANRRTVWTVTTRGNGTSKHAKVHFATFPPDLIEPCILAGCPRGGRVLDPFGGSGTVAGVALKHGRNATMIELNPDYAAIIPERVSYIVGGDVAEGDDLPSSVDFGEWFG